MECDIQDGSTVFLSLPLQGGGKGGKKSGKGSSSSCGKGKGKISIDDYRNWRFGADGTRLAGGHGAKTRRFEKRKAQAIARDQALAEARSPIPRNTARDTFPDSATTTSTVPTEEVVVKVEAVV